MIEALAQAQRHVVHTVEAAAFAAIDRAAAYRIQSGVARALGAQVGMLKTAVHPDGVGVAAPIYANHIGRNGYRLPAANVLGLEVEVGLVLGKDVDGPSDLAGAVDHYFTGVEVVGSRFADRAPAGAIGQMADNMSSLGYVIGVEPRLLADDMEGLGVTVDFAGERRFAGTARHGFGSVLASVAAYAGAQQTWLPLKAGTVITTGSLCGLVPAAGAGHVSARLGEDTVEFDLV